MLMEVDGLNVVLVVVPMLQRVVLFLPGNFWLDHTFELVDTALVRLSVCIARMGLNRFDDGGTLLRDLVVDSAEMFHNLCRLGVSVAHSRIFVEQLVVGDARCLVGREAVQLGLVDNVSGLFCILSGFFLFNIFFVDFLMDGLFEEGCLEFELLFFLQESLSLQLLLRCFLEVGAMGWHIMVIVIEAGAMGWNIVVGARLTDVRLLHMQTRFLGDWCLFLSRLDHSRLRTVLLLFVVFVEKRRRFEAVEGFVRVVVGAIERFHLEHEVAARRVDVLRVEDTAVGFEAARGFVPATAVEGVEVVAPVELEFVVFCVVGEHLHIVVQHVPWHVDGVKARTP